MEVIAHHRDRELEVDVERTPHGYRITVGGTVYEVDAALAGDGLHSLLLEGCQHEVAVERQAGDRYLVTTRDSAETVTLVDPLAALAQKAHGSAAAGGPQRVDAYMPGRVVQILAAEGDELEPGQSVLVLEAMKMKNEIQAEHSGVLRRILVEEGQAVEGGDPLFEFS